MISREAMRVALASYQEHSAIRFTTTREQAKDRLIGDWADLRDSQPEKSSLILAPTRADVTELNRRARAVLKQRGELKHEVKVETLREVKRDDGSLTVERGERLFATGDRVMFLKMIASLASRTEVWERLSRSTPIQCK